MYPKTPIKSIYSEILGTKTPINSGINSRIWSEIHFLTLVYRCDPIRGRKAKIALIDCAHRETELNAKELRAKLIEAVSDKIRKGQKVVLPVPQYGRGLELLVLMRRTFPNLRVCVDSDFVTYAKKMLSERMWYFADAYECMNNEELYEMEIFGTQMPVYDYDILLLADTHLKKRKMWIL